MKAYLLCTLISIGLFIILTNAKPKPSPCGAGLMGMTYCNKSWREIFGGSSNYYGGGGNMSPGNGFGGSSSNNTSGGSGQPTLHCVGCTLNYVGNGENNTNQVHIHENKNPFAQWHQWGPRFPGPGMNNGGNGGMNSGGNGNMNNGGNGGMHNGRNGSMSNGENGGMNNGGNGGMNNGRNGGMNNGGYRGMYNGGNGGMYNNGGVGRWNYDYNYYG